jgi:hypothetical protein
MQWRRICAEHPAVRNEPLCLHLQCSAGNLFSNTDGKKLVIILPMSPHWVMWFRYKMRRDQHPSLKDIPSFVQLVSNFRPLLHLQWAEVTIKLCEKATANPSGVQDFDSSFFELDASHENYPYYLTRVEEAKTDGVALDIDYAQRILHAFWQALVDLQNNDVDYLGRTGRLVVNYNNAFKATRIDPAFSLHFSKLFGAFMLYVNDSKYPKLLPKPKRGWIAKVMEGDHDQRG